MANARQITLGLRSNVKQFSFLILINAFVGAMVGLERSILPMVAEHDFQLTSKVVLFSFILSFGIAKAFTNYWAGHLSDRYGRKPVLIGGWLMAIPVPFILLWAPDWDWIILANVLLGVSQGVTWSTTVIMKVDLVGSKQRGLAMGLNEFAGYAAVALSALAAGWVASSYGLRDPFYLGIAYVGAGLLLSAAIIRETKHYAEYEAETLHRPDISIDQPRGWDVFCRTSFKDRNLSTISQAGMVNNLNDGMAWGLFPIVFAAANLNLKEIGGLVAIYPGVWGVTQIFTGILSDYLGRKWFIVGGMWVQALGIVMIALSTAFPGFMFGSVLLGVGTAMVYPTLLAAIGDVAHPSWRASAIGVYRLWRDLGYAVGALITGVAADLFGLKVAILIIAGITALSGAVSLIRMQETLRKT